MKILFIAKYIYIENDSDFAKNKTGYGIMVRDIANSIAKNGNDVFIYTNVITKQKNYRESTIYGHKWDNVFGSASLRDWIDATKALIIEKGSLKRRIRLFYYRLDCGYLRKVIETVHPDIVHIHGISARTEEFIHILDELRVPYCFTLHALIGISDIVEGEKIDTLYEKDFINKAIKKQIPVSLISTGMLQRIQQHYGIKDRKKLKTFKIIFNGTDLRVIKKKISMDIVHELLKKYSIPEGKKVILCVGNICDRKNQIIIPEIASCIDQDTLNDLVFIVAGRDFLNGELDSKIKRSGKSDSIKNIGYVEKPDLQILQSIAYGTMVVSIDEAFGLSVIEGYANGVPAIMYGDLDAALDLYDPSSCMLVNERMPECYARALTEFVHNTWYKNKIRCVAKQFSLDKMTIDYIRFYEECIDEYKKR